jgi:hypothetical protein
LLGSIHWCAVDGDGSHLGVGLLSESLVGGLAAEAAVGSVVCRPPACWYRGHEPVQLGPVEGAPLRHGDSRKVSAVFDGPPGRAARAPIKPDGLMQHPADDLRGSVPVAVRRPLQRGRREVWSGPTAA